MENKHFEIIKKYGKTRCLDVHYYLERLGRDYNFPYSDATHCEMLEDFQEYTPSDFSLSHKKLIEMKFFGAINRSHIKKACEEAKAERIREEKFNEKPLPVKGCPMPPHIKKKLAKILS